MHIPDGFLDTKTIVATTTLSVMGVGSAWQQTRARMPARRIPLLGVAAAFVFAAQMLNFPVAGGTSGHLIGAVLASVLLGPGPAVIVITAVLVVQCLLFADGGVLALGANIFNMAIIGTIGGYSIYRFVAKVIPGERGRMLAIFLASWGSVVLASLCCAGELSWSGTVTAGGAFPAMAGIHAVIGVGEGLITSLVITGISKARPDLLASTPGQESSRSFKNVVVYGALISFGLILFVSPFASSWPDGLNRVASEFGFNQKALQNRISPSILPDYRFPGVGAVPMATMLGGSMGVILILVLSFLVARMLMRKPKPRRYHESPEHT